tara:strand:+ start:4 stop:303 length:300 start_codon:yes stop_codon:yes gene_type:complete
MILINIINITLMFLMVYTIFFKKTYIENLSNKQKKDIDIKKSEVQKKANDIKARVDYFASKEYLKLYNDATKEAANAISNGKTRKSDKAKQAATKGKTK